MRISDWSSDVCSSDLFLLHRPQQAARLVEIAVVGPTVERGEALLPGIRAAATVGGTISARAVPRHADEERTIMPIVGRPPRLAVGHQRGQIILHRLIVERSERRGVIEILDRKSTRLNSSH